MKTLAAVVLTLCASSVLAAPIVTNNAGYGGSTIGVFGSPAGATFPNTHHGQSFSASDTAYHSIGVDIDEVYGLGTRGFFDPGANFDMRFQLFAGVGTGGALLRTIDYNPGPGRDGWLDLDVTGIAFTNGGSYTATFSAADESGEHLWFVSCRRRVSMPAARASRTGHLWPVGTTSFGCWTRRRPMGVFAAVPAPAGLGLLVLGLAGLARTRRAG